MKRQEKIHELETKLDNLIEQRRNIPFNSALFRENMFQTAVIEAQLTALNWKFED